MARARTRKIDSSGSQLFVLALGLLVGFVIAFVLLLSRLPIDDALSDFNPLQIRTADTGFQFYSVLQEQTVDDKVRAIREMVPMAAVIQPATRVVSGESQSLTPRNLAAESYAEIPPTSLGKESYFLQAGNYRNASDAEQARAALLLIGLDAFVVVRQDNHESIKTYQ